MNPRRTTVLLAAAWLLAALPGCGDDYGITPSQPLGTFEVMDRVLADQKGLEKSERTFEAAELFGRRDLVERFGELKVYEYREHAKTSLTKHVVLLGVDEVHIIRAVGGSFHSGRKAFSDSGSKVESFLASWFAVVNGRGPAFEKKNEPGADLNEYLATSLRKGKVQGIWKKSPTSGNLDNHRTIQDRILVWIE